MTSKAGPEKRGEAAQQVIPGLVAALVIGLLQPIDVDEGYGQRSSLPASTCDLAIQGGDAGGASKHAGQLVEGRLLAQLEQGFGADREQLAGAEAEIVGDRQASLGVAGAARLGPGPPEEQKPSRDQERKHSEGRQEGDVERRGQDHVGERDRNAVHRIAPAGPASARS